ncbi:MAG: NblA/ycf18 family protein [Spirulina sp.]
MNPPNQLSLEQEFNLKKFSDRVQNLSREQAQELLVELSRQMMIKENLYKQLLKPYLGLA